MEAPCPDTANPLASTLLIASASRSWRPWLKEHLGDADLLCLDPADPAQGIPARVCLLREHKPVLWRFIGSLDPLRSPHVLISAVHCALTLAKKNLTAQLFPYRRSPLALQTMLLVSQMVGPGRVLAEEGLDLPVQAFSGDVEPVSLAEAHSAPVQAAQRKAQWIRLLEVSQEHDLDLRSVAIEGSRLGAGHAIGPDERARMGLEDALRVERCGRSLLIVSDREIDERQVLRAQDLSHCDRARLVSPASYRGLTCSFSRVNGEDFGMGIIRSIDWEGWRASVLGDAVPPAPARILRMGSLRVSDDGSELGELRPWQV